MKLQIEGNGVFGSFLKEILLSHFEIVNDAESVVLAVPIDAYEEVASKNKGKHLINVCSVQKPSTDICLKYSDKVTSIHPLFGPRTPKNKYNSILTYSFTKDNDTWLSQESIELEFLKRFQTATNFIIKADKDGKLFTPESHDLLMFKTHCKCAIIARMIKPFIETSKDIPDEYLTHSFRQLREFMKTIEDMPKGTMDSIMANPYY